MFIWTIRHIVLGNTDHLPDMTETLDQGKFYQKYLPTWTRVGQCLVIGYTRVLWFYFYTFTNLQCLCGDLCSSTHGWLVMDRSSLPYKIIAGLPTCHDRQPYGDKIICVTATKLLMRTKKNWHTLDTREDTGQSFCLTRVSKVCHHFLIGNFS